MKISEIIEELTRIKEIHGEVECKVNIWHPKQYMNKYVDICLVKKDVVCTKPVVIIRV